MKRVKDTLRAFESKFNNQMWILWEDVTNKNNEFWDFNRQKLKETNERMNSIEDSIIVLKEEWIRETEEAVNAVKVTLDTV